MAVSPGSKAKAVVAKQPEDKPVAARSAAGVRDDKVRIRHLASIKHFDPSKISDPSHREYFTHVYNQHKETHPHESKGDEAAAAHVARLVRGYHANTHRHATGPEDAETHEGNTPTSADGIRQHALTMGLKGHKNLSTKGALHAFAEGAGLHPNIVKQFAQNHIDEVPVKQIKKQAAQHNVQFFKSFEDVFKFNTERPKDE